jgi:Zn-dependent M28 family amino/carboxypeptidase
LLNSETRAQTAAGSELRSDLIDVRQLLVDLKVLSDDVMEGRRSGTAGNARARDYIVQRFKSAGISMLGDSYLFPFSRGVNVAGYIRGTTYPDKYIVVTAHYDHLGIQRGRIYNGAVDNASGVAALFALGQYFQRNRPEHSLLFVAFDAEESDLQGSQAFLRAPAVPRAAMLANVNIDMIGRDSNRALYAVGTYLQPFLKPLLDRVISTAPVKLLLGHDRPEQGNENWTDQSDHYSFFRSGIPFIFFSVEDYGLYHTPNDDYETVMPDFYAGCVETILNTIQVVDQSLRGIPIPSK